MRLSLIIRGKGTYLGTGNTFWFSQDLTLPRQKDIDKKRLSSILTEHYREVNNELLDIQELEIYKIKMCRKEKKRHKKAPWKILMTKSFIKDILNSPT